MINTIIIQKKVNKKKIKKKVIDLSELKNSIQENERKI
jgi:hypothetical protein